MVRLLYFCLSVCTFFTQAKREILAYSFHVLKQHRYSSLTRFFHFIIVGDVLVDVQNDLATGYDTHSLVHKYDCVRNNLVRKGEININFNIYAYDDIMMMCLMIL